MLTNGFPPFKEGGDRGGYGDRSGGFSRGREDN